jgi:DNA replication protein DnaC
MMSELQDQAVRQHCKTLRMPTIGGEFARLGDAASREGQSHVGYLEALLVAEMEERESRAISRLLQEARLPRMKTLEAFEFDRSGVSPGQLRTLAEGDYVTRAEPILLVGEAGTGKTKLHEVADQTRKATAQGSFFLFFSMLIGAFIASVAGALGGRQRDEL